MGRWQLHKPELDPAPFTWRPEPTASSPDPPTFTSNYTPYNLFGTSMRVTWNGVYLQLSHHQPFVRGNLHTTCFHRQLAVDHANHNNIPLPGNFHVHHTNGRKYDNHISNLDILTPQQHHQRHQQQPPRPKPKPKPKPFHRRRVRRQ